MNWIKFYDPITTPPGVYKYVKAGGKWYVFDITYSHREVAANVEGEPEAAGFIGVYDDFVKFDDPWSSTLKLGTTDDQKKELAALFAKRIKDRHEWP